MLKDLLVGSMTGVKTKNAWPFGKAKCTANSASSIRFSIGKQRTTQLIIAPKLEVFI
jgi:hypothetical protein